MKRLFIVVVVLAALWSAYWFVAAQTARAAYADWFEARQAEGWQAEYAKLRIAGFPSRLDASFDDPILADPETGLAWSAAFFQILTLSYQPNHIIATWPQTQTIATPTQRITIDSKKMQASLVLSPDTDLALARSNFAAERIAVASTDGWEMKAESIQAAVHQDQSHDSSYQIAYQASSVAPPSFLRNGVLPKTMSTMDLDLFATFDRPWDLRSLEERRPQPVQLDLKRAKAEWGDLLIEAAGSVSVDDTGSPTGDVTLRAKNWRQMIEIARASEQLSEVSVATAEQILGLLASLSGSDGDIDATVTLRNNTAWIGILPIGPAPKIILR